MKRVNITRSRPTPDLNVPPSSAPISLLIDAWVAEGLINAEEGAQLKARSGDVRLAAVARRRGPERSLAIEALGYLGGVIAVVGTVSMVAQYWDEISTLLRLALAGAVASGLVAGGFAVPRNLGEVGGRLRAVLWLAGTAATSGFLALLGAEVLELADAHVALLASGGAAVLATSLWAMGRGPLQQVAMMLGLMLTAAAAIAAFASPDSLPGLGVWGVAAIWVMLGWGQVLQPRRLALIAGSAAMVFGAMITSAEDAGTVLALATTTAIIVAALAFRDLTLLVIGAAAALLVLPTAVSNWFPDTVAAPLALLVVGGAMVVAAVWTARRHGGTSSASDRHWATGRPDIAWATVGVVAAGVLAVTILSSVL